MAVAVQPAREQGTAGGGGEGGASGVGVVPFI
jgi:hypothetical protein